MITPIDQRRIQRNRRRVEELRVWRNAREVPLTDIQFIGPSGEHVGVSLGDGWPEVATPVQLTITGTVPAEFAGQPVELELGLGGEGFAEISVDDGATITAGVKKVVRHIVVRPGQVVLDTPRRS